MEMALSSYAELADLHKLNASQHQGEGAHEGFDELSDGTRHQFAPVKYATIFVIDCSFHMEKELPRSLFDVKNQHEIRATSKGEVYSPTAPPNDSSELFLSPKIELESLSSASDLQRVTRPSSQTSFKRNNASAWHEIFSGISNYAKFRVVASQLDKIGVVLFGSHQPSHEATFLGDFGSRKSQDIEAPGPGIYDLIMLDFMSVQTMTQLEEMAILSFYDFNRVFRGHKPIDSALNTTPLSPKFSDLFWHLQDIYKKRSKKARYIQKVYFITANDEGPFSVSPEEKSIASQRLKDMLDEVASVDFIPIQMANARLFDFSKFYEDLILQEKNGRSGYAPKLPTPVRLEQLASVIRRKDTPQRILSQMLLTIWEGVTVAVNAYALVSEHKTPLPIFLDSETHAPLHAITHWLCSKTGDILKPSDIKRYYMHGECKIPITNKEKQELARYPWCETSSGYIRLSGFVTLEELRRWHPVKQPYFLYPDDGSIYGSSSLITGLITSMHKKQVFALAHYALHEDSIPRACALLPQFEEVEEGIQEAQIHPPGLHLLPLPFADDIRIIPTALPRAAPEDTDNSHDTQRQQVASNLVRELLYTDFDLHCICNPSVQFHYAQLEALALSLAEPRKVLDYTQKPISEAAEMSAAQLRDLVLKSSKSQPSQHGHKQAAEYSTKLPRNKPIDSSNVLRSRLFRQLNTQGQLGTLLLPQLKSYLQKKKLPISGTKRVLMERISQYLNRTPHDSDSD